MKEAILCKLANLRKDAETVQAQMVQAQANLYGFQGAILVCEQLLAELPEETPQPPSQQ